MEIAVIGAGYVGLTSAACLAEIGHRVVCADNDVQKLNLLQSGKMPFFEPHLEEMVKRNCEAGRLEFTLPEEAIDRGRAIFICVGTPPMENGEADLSAIGRVARTIAERAVGHRLVIEKSTVPVQTGRQLQKHLALYRNGRDFSYDVVSNPEFLREGTSVEDFLHPDRIVVGTQATDAAELMKEIYRSVLDQTFACPVHPKCENRKRVPMVVTDIESAELIKHTANSFLAMKISFINMISDLCETVGADIDKIAEGIGLDPRIGPSFLSPGIGYGGFCFPKDLQAFVAIGEKFGCDFSLLQEVEKINLRRVEQFVQKTKEELWVLRGKKVGVWGLSFKPDTDDIRFAPSLTIIRRLLSEGVEIQAYDPEAMGKAKGELPEIQYCDDPYEAAKGTEAILALTEWKEFREVDLDRVRSLMVRPLIIDGRNMFSEERVISHGFDYVSVGRAASVRVKGLAGTIS